MHGELIVLVILIILAAGAGYIARAWRRSRLVDKIHDGAYRVKSQVMDAVDKVTDDAEDYQELNEFGERMHSARRDLDGLDIRVRGTHAFFFEIAPEVAGFDVRRMLTPEQARLCDLARKRHFGRTSREGLIRVYELDPDIARQLTEDRRRSLAWDYGDLLVQHAELYDVGPSGEFTTAEDIAAVGEMIDNLEAQIDELMSGKVQ